MSRPDCCVPSGHACHRDGEPRAACAVCGADGSSHQFGCAPLCARHAEWLDDEVSAVPETLTYDGADDYYIERDVWDDLVARMAEEDAERGPIFVCDPLDGLSLGGVL